jgi:hypothetical protein
MRLLSAPRKMPSMTGFGLEVEGFEPPPASPASPTSQPGTVHANQAAVQRLA